MHTYAAARRAEHAHEPAYNMARALHHLGFSHLAVTYYEQVLGAVLSAESGSSGAAGTLPDGKDQKDQSLLREAAHNLTKLCQASGAHDLARAITRSFNTV